MDSVFLLMSNYYDGCDIFTKVVDVYADRDTALLEQYRLEDELGPEDTEMSWNVVEMKVIR